MNTHRTEWIGMLTSVCVVLGGLLALTVKTQQSLHARVFGVNNSVELQQEWEVLQHKIAVLQSELAREHTRPGAAVADDRLSMLSGITPVTGPGVTVTLTDSPMASSQKPDSNLPPSIVNAGIIHDVDLQRVVNELFAAGAEAVAINGQRIGPLTAIRCVGPVVNINQVGCAAPFHIEAIGKSETLVNALHLPGGQLQELSNFQCGVTIEPAKQLLLPAYDGAVSFRYARPVVSPTKDQDQS